MRLYDLFHHTRLNESTMIEWLADKTFYHGTSHEDKAKSILKNGLQPGNTSGQARGHLTPVSGRSYLTVSLAFGQIYAIGGNVAGSFQKPVEYGNRRGNEYGLDDFIRNSGSRYGYLLVFPGKDLINDVQPDEDSVGVAVQYAYDIYDKNSSGAEFYGSDQIYQYLTANRDFAQALLHAAHYGMTPKQFDNAINGYIDGQASGGKRMLRSMSPGMKLRLIQAGAHVAYQGNLKPAQAWRIDKRKIPILKNDASNFFEQAQLVWPKGI